MRRPSSLTLPRAPNSADTLLRRQVRRHAPGDDQEGDVGRPVGRHRRAQGANARVQARPEDGHGPIRARQRRRRRPQGRSRREGLRAAAQPQAVHPPLRPRARVGLGCVSSSTLSRLLPSPSFLVVLSPRSSPSLSSLEHLCKSRFAHSHSVVSSREPAFPPRPPPRSGRAHHRASSSSSRRHRLLRSLSTTGPGLASPCRSSAARRLGPSAARSRRPRAGSGACGRRCTSSVGLRLDVSSPAARLLQRRSPPGCSAALSRAEREARLASGFSVRASSRSWFVASPL